MLVLVFIGTPVVPQVSFTFKAAVNLSTVWKIMRSICSICFNKAVTMGLLVIGCHINKRSGGRLKKTTAVLFEIITSVGLSQRPLLTVFPCS